MNIRQMPGKLDLDNLSFPYIVPASQAIFLAMGMLVPTPDRHGLGAAKEHGAMPIDQRRRDNIAAAVAACDRDHPDTPLPRNTVRLLTVMFLSEDVCHRSLDAIAAEGLNRTTLPATLRRLVEAQLLSRRQGSGAVPHAYRLHLPALVQS